ncbi:hypothetical protein WJX74_007351 [Apatococcus lobatus]|uniref:Uncharacterized protein n=1 Tax=Apatococcus lobatus TaxID=904363 RepID=A0AAW1RTJ4_9CHLO
MAAKGLTPHYFFTWGVTQEAVHDDIGSHLARQTSGWRSVLGLGKADGSSAPAERILQIDVASKAVNTIAKEVVKDTYQVTDVLSSDCLEGQDLRLFINLRDGRRLTYFFQSNQDVAMFRELMEELQTGEYAGVRYPRNVLKRGVIQKRGRTGVFFDRFAVLVPEKMYVLSSKAAVYPLNVISLADNRPAMDETIKAIWVKVPKKEYLLRGLSEDDTRDWFDVMRPIPQVILGAADSADLGLTRTRNRGQFMEALEEPGDAPLASWGSMSAPLARENSRFMLQAPPTSTLQSFTSSAAGASRGFRQNGAKSSELRSMLSKAPSLAPSGAYSPRIASVRSNAAGLLQQGTMRKDHLASRVSFSPSSLPSHRSMHGARMQNASLYNDSMLHAQNNSMDAVFSRITGQPGAMLAYEPSPELDEQAPNSPGIFEKWRSALVDSLDNDDPAASDMYAADLAGGSFPSGETSFTEMHTGQHAAAAGASMPMHPSPESTGPLLPLSRQSSRPVSPTRAGHWVKVGSPGDTYPAPAASSSRAEAATGSSPRTSAPHQVGNGPGPTRLDIKGAENGEFGDARRRVMRKSASQSSLSSLTAQAGAIHSKSNREVAIPQPVLHPNLSRPGSAGSMNKSRLSKMSTPDLQALGLVSEPEDQPRNVQQVAQVVQDIPQASIAHPEQDATGILGGLHADNLVGADAAPALDNLGRDDAQQTRSMAASLEEMLSKAQAALADISRIQQSQSMVRPPIVTPLTAAVYGHSQPYQPSQDPGSSAACPGVAFPDQAHHLFAASQAATASSFLPGSTTQRRVPEPQASPQAAVRDLPNTAQMSLQEMLGNIAHPTPQHVYAHDSQQMTISPSYDTPAIMRAQELRQQVPGGYEQQVAAHEAAPVIPIDPSLAGAPPPKRRQIPRPVEPPPPAAHTMGYHHTAQDQPGLQDNAFPEACTSQAYHPWRDQRTGCPEANTAPCTEPDPQWIPSQPDGGPSGHAAGSMISLERAADRADSGAEADNRQAALLHVPHEPHEAASSAAHGINIPPHHVSNPPQAQPSPPPPSPPGRAMFAGRFKLRGTSPSHAIRPPSRPPPVVPERIAACLSSIPAAQSTPDLLHDMPASTADLDDLQAAAATAVAKPAAAAEEGSEEGEAQELSNSHVSSHANMPLEDGDPLQPKPSIGQDGRAKPPASVRKQAASAGIPISPASQPTSTSNARKLEPALSFAQDQLAESQATPPCSQDIISATAEASEPHVGGGGGLKTRPLRKTVSWRANALFDEKNDLIQRAGNLHEMSLDLRKWLGQHGVLVPHHRSEDMQGPAGYAALQQHAHDIKPWLAATAMHGQRQQHLQGEGCPSLQQQQQQLSRYAWPEQRPRSPPPAGMGPFPDGALPGLAYPSQPAAEGQRADLQVHRSAGQFLPSQPSRDGHQGSLPAGPHSRGTRMPPHNPQQHDQGQRNDCPMIGPGSVDAADWQQQDSVEAGRAGALVVHAPGEPTAIYSAPGPLRNSSASVSGASKLGPAGLAVMLAPGMRVVVEHNGSMQAASAQHMLHQNHPLPPGHHIGPPAEPSTQGGGMQAATSWQQHSEPQQQQHASVPLGCAGAQQYPDQQQQPHQQQQQPQHSFYANSAADAKFLPKTVSFKTSSRQDGALHQAGFENVQQPGNATNSDGRPCNRQQSSAMDQPDMRQHQTHALPTQFCRGFAPDTANMGPTYTDSGRSTAGFGPHSSASWPGQGHAEGGNSSHMWLRNQPSLMGPHTACVSAALQGASSLAGRSPSHPTSKCAEVISETPSVPIHLGDNEHLTQLMVSDFPAAIQPSPHQQTPAVTLMGMPKNANADVQAPPAVPQMEPSQPSAEQPSSGLQVGSKEQGSLGLSQLPPDLQAQLMRLLQLKTAAPVADPHVSLASATDTAQKGLPDYMHSAPLSTISPVAAAAYEPPQQQLPQHFTQQQQPSACQALLLDLPITAAGGLQQVHATLQGSLSKPLDARHAISSRPGYLEELEASMTTPRQFTRAELDFLTPDVTRKITNAALAASASADSAVMAALHAISPGRFPMRSAQKPDLDQLGVGTSRIETLKMALFRDQSGASSPAPGERAATPQRSVSPPSQPLQMQANSKRPESNDEMTMRPSSMSGHHYLPQQAANMRPHIHPAHPHSPHPFPHCYLPIAAHYQLPPARAMYSPYTGYAATGQTLHATSRPGPSGISAMPPTYAGSPWAIAQDAQGQMKVIPMGQMQQVMASQMTPTHAVNPVTSASAHQPTSISTSAELDLQRDHITSQTQHAIELSSDANTHEQQKYHQGPAAGNLSDRHGMGNSRSSDLAVTSKTSSTTASSQRRASVPAQLHASPKPAFCPPATSGFIRAAHEQGQQPAALHRQHSQQAGNHRGPQSMAALGLRAAVAPPEADRDVTAKRVAADVWGIQLRRYSGKY